MNDAVVRHEVCIREVVELHFRSEKRYDNPYLVVSLTAVFTSPDGVRSRVAGF